MLPNKLSVIDCKVQLDFRDVKIQGKKAVT